jgi:hypothetical protein
VSIFIKRGGEKMKKIITAVLSMMAGLALFFAVGVTPAAADYNWCVTGMFCAWDYDDGLGQRWDLPHSVYGNGSCHTLGSSKGWNRWESVRNDWGDYYHRYTVRMYTGDGCSGDYRDVTNNNQYNPVTNLTLPNNIQSVRRL